MDDEKVFDVKKVKVETFEKKPEKLKIEKPSAVKLHLRFFDWHTIAFVLYGVAILLGFIAAALLTRYLVVKKQAEINEPSKIEQKVVQSDVTVSPEETKKVGENPFAPPATPEAEVDKKSIKLRVLNGNGITGDAAKAKKQLEDAGFTVSKVGNAKRQDYTITQVYYLAGKKSQAELVEKALKDAGRSTQLEEASADLVGADTEVLVVTGKK